MAAPVGLQRVEPLDEVELSALSRGAQVLILQVGQHRARIGDQSFQSSRRLLV